MQWLGDRSYSLYLWHWPIVVMITYLEYKNDPKVIFFGIALTLILAILSYELVESPARQKLGQYKVGKGIIALTFFAAIIAIPSFLIWHNHGVSGRFSETVDVASLESFNKNLRQSECTLVKGTESPNCIFGGNKVKAILLGDSHADATITALAAAIPGNDGGILNWTYMGCPALFGIKRLSNQIGVQCDKFLERSRQKLNDFPKNVPLVIINRTSLYALGFNELWESEINRPLIYFTKPHNSPDAEFMKEFSKNLVDSACILAKNRTVYLVRPFPEMGMDIPKSMSRAMILGKKPDPSISLESYHERHRLIWAAQDAAQAQCGIEILDPLPYLCHDGRCYGSKNGRPLYFDDDHLSEYGNKLLIPMFSEVFSRGSTNLPMTQR